MTTLEPAKSISITAVPSELRNFKLLSCALMFFTVIILSNVIIFALPAFSSTGVGNVISVVAFPPTLAGHTIELTPFTVSILGVPYVASPVPGS